MKTRLLLNYGLLICSFISAGRSMAQVLTTDTIDDKGNADNAIRVTAHWWPINDNNFDLGSSSLSWRSAYIGQSLAIGTSSPLAKLDVRGNIINGGSDFVLGRFDGRNQGTFNYNRALVHWGPVGSSTDLLVINFANDFESGVRIDGQVKVNGSGSSLFVSNTGDSEAGIIFEDDQDTAKTSKFLMNSANGELSLYYKGNTAFNLSSPHTNFNQTKVGTSAKPLQQYIYAPDEDFFGPGYSGQHPAVRIQGTGNYSSNYISMGVHEEPWIGADVGAGGALENHVLQLTSHVKVNPRTSGNDVFDIIGWVNDTILDVDQERVFFSKAVGIGTSTFPLNAGYNLFVKGGIRTEKVKVDGASLNGWGDYVFDNNYTLKPLEEVEDFVEENKHLPDVPSAKELEQEGLDLAEMQKLQMVKIEELTLYLIDLNKENAKLREEMKELEKERIQVEEAQKLQAMQIEKLMRSMQQLMIENQELRKNLNR